VKGNGRGWGNGEPSGRLALKPFFSFLSSFLFLGVGDRTGDQKKQASTKCSTSPKVMLLIFGQGCNKILS
jgi:hypothetical protein